jgi:hypothetical protein
MLQWCSLGLGFLERHKTATKILSTFMLQGCNIECTRCVEMYTECDSRMQVLQLCIFLLRFAFQRHGPICVCFHHSKHIKENGDEDQMEKE